LSVALASGIESQRKTTSANFAPDLNFADLWPTALTKARQKIQDAIKADPSSFVAVFSPFMTVEEAYLLAKFIKGIHDKARLVLGPVPSVGVDDKYPKGPKGESPADGNVKFTIRAEKCPNRLGVEAVLKHFEGSVVRIESIAQRPNAHAWYIVGGYTSGWVTEAIDKAIGTPSLLIVQDIFPSPLSERADIVLASGSFAEKDGTYVNHAGLAQSASAAVRAPGEARADGRILMELAGRTGLFNAMALRKEIGAAIPELSVLGSGDLGDQGVRLVRFAKQATAAAT
jgi:NADH-quinone oxidoreductase subunit G